METTLLKERLFRELQTMYSRDEIQTFGKWIAENLVGLSDQASENLVQKALNDLKMHRPVQYIFGYGYFHRYKFKVNEHTLIPRPETEELCELILSENNNRCIKGIDIGTGSGCIPLTLLSERPNWIFTAIDISEGAIEVAQLNSKILNLQNRCAIILKDFFEMIDLPNDYEIIVSNPPYIHPNEFEKLDSTVLDFEPHTALFVNTDVMEYYTALRDYFRNNTHPNCQLWMETHQDYCNMVYELFDGEFSAKKIEDFSQNPRFVKVTKP